MSEHPTDFSLVTAVLPNSSAARITPKLLERSGANMLTWKARGTLLQDHWFKRWLPPISPIKSMLQMLVPNAEAGRVVSSVVEDARLHQQATGAVFSTPCQNTFFGNASKPWPMREGAELSKSGHDLSENLTAIFCIVGPRLSDRVAKAAIRAGAHGPLVYYSEGRGLRDRLGWLRITKENEKEVLMVLTEESQADDLFATMANAGELHLPGRGFMYRLKINRGLFNLPSRITPHHYDANMQQIIHAIDHLNGHKHWRDQAVFDVGGGRGVGFEAPKNTTKLVDQVCLSTFAPRDDCQVVMDCLLDNGAPGLSMSLARYTANSGANLGQARVSGEFGMLRCITDEVTAARLRDAVAQEKDTAEFERMCLFTNAVPMVATYVPGAKDYREASPLAEAS